MVLEYNSQKPFPQQNCFGIIWSTSDNKPTNAKEHQGLQDDEGITYIQTLQLGRLNNLEYVTVKVVAIIGRFEFVCD